jgi:hypothetical protein
MNIRIDYENNGYNITIDASYISDCHYAYWGE